MQNLTPLDLATPLGLGTALGSSSGWKESSCHAYWTILLRMLSPPIGREGTRSLVATTA